MKNNDNRSLLIILIIIIVGSIIGFTYFVYNSKKISKENAIKYEEEKDKPEFNALTKKNYYPIGTKLPEDIILSKN